MNKSHILLMRRIVFWATIIITATVSGLIWSYFVMLQLGSAVAPELIITGVDRGYTAVLLIAISSSCIPIAMWAGGQPLQHAEIDQTYRISMDDVARAYVAAHQADRSGAFRLAGEFDSVRERMDLLSKHPDLEILAPELRLVGAQMSVLSRELAFRYNDQAIFEAEALIAQCMKDCEELEQRVNHGFEVEAAIRTIARELDLRAATATSQWGSLRQAIVQELQPLGLTLSPTNEHANVFPINKSHLVE